MATVETEKKPMKQGEGLRQYYLQRIHELQLQVRHKTHNLQRLEAQRNELNSRGLVSSVFTFANPNFLDFVVCGLWFSPIVLNCLV